MAVFIIGLMLLIAGRILEKLNDKRSFLGRPVMGLGILLILGGILFASVVQIDAGRVGVKKLYGHVQPDVLYSGLHLINPLMDVETIETRTQNYTMSGAHN